LLSCEPAGAVRQAHRTKLIVHAELGEDRANLGTYREHRNVTLLGDLSHPLAETQRDEHLGLTPAEPREGGESFDRLPLLRGRCDYEASTPPHREMVLARQDPSKDVHQMLERTGLCHDTEGSCRDATTKCCVVRAGTQHHDPDPPADEVAKDRQGVNSLAELEVEDGKIQPLCAQSSDLGRTAISDTGEKTPCAQYLGERLTDEAVVVDDSDPAWDRAFARLVPSCRMTLEGAHDTALRALSCWPARS